MAAETTSLARGSQRFGVKLSSSGLVGAPLTCTFGTTDNQLDDVMQAGYIPAGVTVVGFLVHSTDMDTAGSPAVVHAILLGATTLVAGITAAQAGGSAVYACTPTTTTAATVLSVKSTTAAGTAAAGTMYVTPLYFSAGR
jgi:hypothetical protein